MTELFLYLLKVTAGTAAFYFIYYTFLKNETYFKLNRFYLIASVLLSFVLPLINFSDKPIELPSGISETLNTVSVFSNQPVISDVNVNFTSILLIIYIGIASFFILRFFIKIFILALHFMNKKKSQYRENYILINTEKDIPPCSFFNYIIIPDKLSDSRDLPKILTHEMVHVKQYHSIDNLIIEFIVSVLWFNPFAWKIKTAIKNTHEYLADEGVVEQGFDTARYRLLLLEHAVGFKLGLANNLNQSITLKRVLMLNKSKSNWKAKLKVLSAIPVLFLLITAFMCKPDTGNPPLNNNTIEKQVIKEATEQPSFPGGQEAMIKFMIDNIKYPQVAKEKGIQGKVFISFLVKEDGSLTDVVVEKSVNKLLDDEAVRVIKSMPNWIPGKDGNKTIAAKMTLPIDFRLK